MPTLDLFKGENCLICFEQSIANKELVLCSKCSDRFSRGSLRYFLRYYNRLEALSKTPDPTRAARAREAFEQFKSGLTESDISDIENIRKYRRHIIFEDHHWPKKYQESFLYCDANISLFSAGNQVGKTSCLVVKAATYVEAKYPEDWPDKFKFPAPTYGRFLIEDSAEFENRLAPKFKEWMPYWPGDNESNEYWKIEKVNRIIRKCTYLPNGSQFDILAKSQDDEKAEGVTLHWAGIDEPCKYAHYVGTIRGLMRHSGQMFIAATPLLSEVWMYREIFVKGNKSHRKDIKVHTAEIWDNSIENNGYLSRDDISRLLDATPVQLREAREKGVFIFVTGAAYPELINNKDIFIELDPPLDDRWQVISSLDFHPTTPSRWLWMAINQYNQKIFIAELKSEGPVEDQINQALQKEEEWGIRGQVKIRLADRHMADKIKVIQDKKFEPYNAFRIGNQYLASIGETPMRPVTNSEGAIPKVKEMVKPIEHPGLKKKIQPFLIGDKCSELIETLPLYKTDIWKSGPMKGLPKDSMDKGSAGGAHQIDNFHYCLAQNFTYEQVVEQSSKPGTFSYFIQDAMEQSKKEFVLGADLVDV